MTNLNEEELAIYLSRSKYNFLDLLEYKEKNSQIIANSMSIFNYETRDDIELLFNLLFILSPGEYENIFDYFCYSHNSKLSSENFELKDLDQLQMLSCLFFHNEFFIYSKNLCYFLENEILNSMKSKFSSLIVSPYHNNRKRLLILPSSQIYSRARRASNGHLIEDLINNEFQEKTIIENYGTFRITGNNGDEKFTNFFFRFNDDVKNIEVHVTYSINDEKTKETIIFSTKELFEGRREIRKRVKLDYTQVQIHVNIEVFEL